MARKRSTRAVRRAIESGGGLQSLASKVGVKYQAVQKWRKKGIPAERVLSVEAASGVSRHELRPDLYPLTNTPSTAAS